MRHPKVIIASVGLAVAAIGGVTATVATGSPASSATPASSAPASAPATGSAVVRTAQALVGGKTETILVDSRGLPLYFCAIEDPPVVRGLAAEQLARVGLGHRVGEPAPLRYRRRFQIGGGAKRAIAHAIETAGRAAAVAVPQAS